MSSDPPRIAPFGTTTRRRELVAAMVVMGGALPVGLLAGSSVGRPPKLYVVLIAIGVIGTVAWLVDGRRYVAPGAMALGVGVALAIGQETTVDPYALAFGFIGAVLLLLGRINPQAIAAAGGFLVYLASVVGYHRANDTSPRPWLFPLIMVVWGGAHLLRMGVAPGSLSSRVPGGAPDRADAERGSPEDDRLVPGEHAVPLA